MDTWWIDEPDLLGSGNPGDEDLKKLRRCGFGVLISLLKEEEQAPGYRLDQAAALGFERRNIPVRDYHAPAVEQLEQFVTLISTLLPGAKTVVHCKGGSGRTGTFAAAYWVAKGRSAPGSDRARQEGEARRCRDPGARSRTQ